MDAHRRPRVLLTLADRPHPADGGKRRRSAATLAALASLDVDLDVAVLTTEPPVSVPLPPGVQVDNVVQVAMPDLPKLLALLVTAVRRVPFQVAVHRWGVVRRALKGVQAGPYDLVWFGATDHAISLSRAFPSDRVVVDMDDVEVAKLRAYLRLPPDSRPGERFTRVQRRVELPLWASVQRRVLRLADAVLVCSELDRRRIGAGDNVLVVPNGYAVADGAGPTAALERAGAPVVLLVGTYSYAPNADAAVYAATQVLPLLRELVPDARLRLVGRNADHLPASLSSLDGVDVVGAVPDVAPELSGAWVSLVPVRYGGGTRVKVLESFAHGVPVVSTEVGCEGIDAVDGEHLLVAESARELAEACARVIDEPETSARLSAAGRELVQRYSPRTVERAITAVVERVLPLVEQPASPSGSSPGRGR